MMKKVILYVLLGMSFFSCEDFLTNKEEDKVIPTRAVHFKELVYGELIRSDLDVLSISDVMSDDVSMRWLGGEAVEALTGRYSYYTWQREPEYSLDGDLSADRRYYGLYEDILLCNSIENLLADVTDDPDLVTNIYGEIYFIRAWSYYLLANLYGYPYVDEASSRSTLCVPLNEETGIVDRPYRRATQRVIYDKMERDIQLSIEKFKSSVIPATIYRPNLKAALVLATRIFLTEKKHDEVIAYANELDGDFEGLYDLHALYVKNGGQIDNVGSTNLTTFLNKANKEVVYTFGDYDYSQYRFSPFNAPPRLLTTEGVTKTYITGDLRAKVFFDSKKNPAKTDGYNKNIFGITLRMTEALLNRAEAYQMTGDMAGVTADLNLLRSRRFEPGVDYEIKAGADLLTAVKNERRYEFCFDGIRWFDLRRWGSPRLEHLYQVDSRTMRMYVLEEGDECYTLPIPREEQERNPGLEPINRPERPGDGINNN